MNLFLIKVTFITIKTQKKQIDNPAKQTKVANFAQNGLFFIPTRIAHRTLRYKFHSCRHEIHSVTFSYNTNFNTYTKVVTFTKRVRLQR